METNRQQKIAGIIQRDLADMLRKSLKDGGAKGVLISVTKVNVSTDLSVAKVYLSIFPVSETQSLIEVILLRAPAIRHELAQRTKNQLRRIPELKFDIDDSLEHIDTIEKALKGSENPIASPNLLAKRKKS